MARLYGVGKNLILPYTPFGGGKPVSGIYNPPVPATRSKPKQPGRTALATSGTAASRAAQEKVRLRRIENAKRFAPSPVKKTTMIGPVMRPGTRASLIGQISEPAYPVTKNVEDYGIKPPQRRVLKSAPPEKTPNITIETNKGVYPPTDPIEAAKEATRAKGDRYPDRGLPPSINPIRSKETDKIIRLRKAANADLQEELKRPLPSFDRRALEVQWTGKPTSKKVKINAAMTALIKQRKARGIGPVGNPPVYEQPDKPPQIALDKAAERDRRAAFSERSLRIRAARNRRYESPVFGPKPKPTRKLGDRPPRPQSQEDFVKEQSKIAREQRIDAERASRVAREEAAYKARQALRGGQFKGGAKSGLAGILMDPMVMDPLISAIGKGLIKKDYKQGKYGLGVDLIKKYAPYAKLNLLGF